MSVCSKDSKEYPEFPCPDSNTSHEMFGDKVCLIYANLFLLGGIGGIILLLITKVQWLRIFVFLPILPMVNVWTYQIVKDNKKIKYSKLIRIVVGLASIVTVIYVLKKGVLERIPLMIAVGTLIAYWGFLIATALITFKKWWQRSLIVSGVILAILLFFINKPITINIDCERLSDVVYMDVFGEISTTLSKRAVLKFEGISLAKNWVQKEGAPDKKYDDMGRIIKENENHPTETFVYQRKGGTLRVVFFDNSYIVGLVTFFPDNMYTDDFFKDVSFGKSKSGKIYTIRVNSNKGEKLTVQVTKNNKIEVISYYTD